MRRSVYVCWCLCAAGGVLLFGDPPIPGSGLRLERVGNSTTVRVVANWDTQSADLGTGVQGWSWGVCHDPAAASVGDCLGEIDFEDPCPAVTVPLDMANASPTSWATYLRTAFVSRRSWIS